LLDNLLSKTKFKESFEKFIQKTFYHKISANSLTILGLFLGLCSALLIWISPLYFDNLYILIASVVFLCISFFFDAIDGAVARTGNSSQFGGVLDLFCDRTVEVFVLIAIISTDTFLFWPGIFSLAAIVLCITVFLAIGGAVNEEKLERSEKIIYYANGIMERGETFLFLVVLILIPITRLIILWLFAFLVFITALQRLKAGYELFR
jgi:phosphatidylglycerophosphate synthase